MRASLLQATAHRRGGHARQHPATPRSRLLQENNFILKRSGQAESNQPLQGKFKLRREC